MSTTDMKNVTNIETRLSNLRHCLRISWGELAEELGISRAMLTYLRSEQRNLSPAIAAKIKELESGVAKTTTEVSTNETKELCSNNTEIDSLREQLNQSLEREKALMEIIKNLTNNGVKQ